MNIKKIKQWLHFNPARSGDADYWVEFDKSFKENAPIRYFITRGGFFKFKSKIKYKFIHIKDAISYRVFFRYHIIDSGLPPGYYDECELILHTNFSILVDYVERTSAFKSIRYDNLKETLGYKRFLPWFIVRKIYSSRELGVEHLEWEISLKEENPVQSYTAAEVLDLYTWWKDIRPYREMVKYPDGIRSNGQHVLLHLSKKWREENPESHRIWQEWADSMNKQEEEFYEEDQKMLERLIKVRRNLW